MSRSRSDAPRIQHRPETVALVRAVAAAHAAALVVPCVGRSEWMSENPAQRAVAVVACRPCPVFNECVAAARREGFGVWAGKDLTPRTRS